MALIVQKFGGTSVADLERLQNVASIIARTRAAGHTVVAIVSAMAGVTNQLLSNIKGAHQSIEDKASKQETDAVLAAGEQVTSGLLALCLQDIGITARSFLSWQVPIHTDDTFTNAAITHVETKALRKVLDQGAVPVIAGFQGLCEGRLTTLGRGGSDLTAVAIADALKADFCDIYTDVAGVYTADPRLVSNARKIPQITFDEMLELATHGAKVLQDKCVAYAHAKNVRLRVLSSFHEEDGTEIVKSYTIHSDVPQAALVQGIAHSFQAAKIRLRGARLCPYTVRQALQDKAVNIDGLTHHAVPEQESLQFSITKADLVPAMSALKQLRDSLSLQDIDVDQEVCKVTVVGRGVKDQTDLPARILKALNQAGIFAEVIALADLKMTLIIKENQTTQTIKLLHDALNLHIPYIPYSQTA